MKIIPEGWKVEIRSSKDGEYLVKVFIEIDSGLEVSEGHFYRYHYHR